MGDEALRRPLERGQEGTRLGRWIDYLLVNPLGRCLILANPRLLSFPGRNRQGTDTQSSAVEPYRHEFACHLCVKVRKAILIALLLLVIDPFGWQAASLRASRLVTDRMMAAWEHASAADRIAVVLVDDEAMRLTGQSWPPSFAYWQRLLERIYDFAPAAVMLDVVLGTSRGTAAEVSSLADVIRGRGPDAYRAHAPTVLGDLGQVAALRSGAGPRSAVLPELAAAAEALVWVDWPVQPDPRGYPLRHRWTPPSDVAEGGPVERPLPATALAEIACRRLAQPPAWCQGGTGWLDAAEQKALLPRWSLSADPAAIGVGTIAAARRCIAYEPGNGWLRALRSLAVFATELLHGVRDLLPGVPQTWYRDPPHHDAESEGEREARHTGLPCPPFPQIRAAALLQDGDTHQEELRRLIGGRIVLIGDARAGSTDRMFSPVHAEVPAVFLHATALETLLRYGDDYPRVQPKLLGHRIEQGKLVDYGIKAAAVLLAVLLVFRKRDVLEASLGTAAGSRVAAGSKRAAGHLAQALCCALRRLPSLVSTALFPPARIVQDELPLLERGLRILCRMTVLFTVLALIVAAWWWGLPSSNPILVLLIGLGIAWPVIEVTPLRDPSPDELARLHAHAPHS